METYWQSVVKRRLKRRRAISLAASGSTAALILAACGGGSDSGGTKDVASVLTQIKDESKDVKRGGVFKSRAQNEPANWDPQLVGNTTQTTPYQYSALLRLKEGHLQRTSGELEGDLAESWEVSPDRLTLTFKVNPNAHFAPLPPTNGRSVDAKDIVFSWDRMSRISTRRAEFANSVSPDAPIVSVTSPDDKTVVVKLARPNAVVTAQLASEQPGTFLMVPKEAAEASVLDLSKTPRGSGPWYISEFTPSVGYKYKRNPGFKQDKRDLPYIDELEYPLVQEYAQVMAQFRTGGMYEFLGVRNEDILPLKKELPDIEVRQGDIAVTNMRFLHGHAPQSPVKDHRVREAWSMVLDRDLFLDARANVNAFEAAGLTMERAWEASLQADTWQGWYLNPRDEKAFGPNAKYFKKDYAEAKKLLEAAGFTGPCDIEVHHPLEGADFPTGPIFTRDMEIILGMVDESKLFKVNRIGHRFVPDFLPNYRSSGGKHNGIGFMLNAQTLDPTSYLYTFYHPSGSFTQGTDNTFKSQIEAAMQEFDDARRKAIVHELQRYEGQMLFHPRLASTTAFLVHWPVVRNIQVHQGGTGRRMTTIFLDPSRPPLKKA
jgi:peptide/nickel transport system substrate-binding protein